MTNALAAAMAVLHADPTLGTAADYRRMPGAWAAVQVILSQPIDEAGGLGGIGARAGHLSVSIIDGAPPVATPQRGDELRIGATVYTVESATRDVLAITWRLTLSEQSA